MVLEGDSLSPLAPHRVVNIGNLEPVQLTTFIKAIKAASGLRAERNLMPVQAGDMSATWADAGLLQKLPKPAPPIYEYLWMTRSR